jgi:hypothetical protein
MKKKEKKETGSLRFSSEEEQDQFPFNEFSNTSF